jgi:hypothetical protein
MIMTPSRPRLYGRLEHILETMSEDEIKEFCDGTLNAAVIAQTVFQRRFPRCYASWETLIGLPTNGATQ